MNEYRKKNIKFRQVGLFYNMPSMCGTATGRADALIEHFKLYNFVQNI